MSDATETQAGYSAQEPRPGLQQLERLVGTWNVSGPDIAGQVTFEWMDGGYFLMQHVDFVHGGRHIKGLEIIGYERGWEALMQPEDAAASQDITSHWFDNAGNTFTYTYEVEAHTLTIWGGAKGSPAFYRGTWSDDGDTNAGAWTYPGGGYESTMSRIKP
jgi:hypothetical protein